MRQSQNGSAMMDECYINELASGRYDSTTHIFTSVLVLFQVWY